MRSCVGIGAPPPRVWADLERVETHVEWVADAVRVEPHGGTPAGVGTFTCVTRLGPLRGVACSWSPSGTRSGG
jgi:hypothetical protein